MGGTEQQLESLARRYQHRVDFFTRKVQRTYMLGTRWDDDLRSAGYWGLFKALRNRRPDAEERELSAYVSKRIHGAVIDAARTCITQVRRKEISGGHSGVAGRGDDEHGGERWLEWQHRELDSEDPERLTCREWRRTAIRDALEHLDDDERHLIVSYMEGATLAEIARDEGVPIGTLQGRFRRSTRRLRAVAPELRRMLLEDELQ